MRTGTIRSWRLVISATLPVYQNAYTNIIKADCWVTFTSRDSHGIATLPGGKGRTPFSEFRSSRWGYPDGKSAQLADVQEVFGRIAL